MESSQQQYCWSFSVKSWRSFFVVAFWITYQWTIVENVLWKSNIVEMSYHVEKSISLNGIVATFNSTNIYKIIENRCSSKKCYFEPFYNLKSFIHNGASGRVAEVGQSGSVAKNFLARWSTQHNAKFPSFVFIFDFDFLCIVNQIKLS